MSDDNKEQMQAPRKPFPVRLAIALGVLGLFAVLLAVKAAPPRAASPNPQGGTSLTSVHNDAVADHDAALRAGKPIYVLFHSLSCVPCVEISEVADQVVPDYADRVTFVNVISDDPSGKQLASRFEFQYIPTSFFLGPDGTVVGSHTGPLTSEQMRAQLDALLEAE